ncbi:MAG: stage III sporulation protein AB [Clostridia bacterium]|nr:stage III sporulation protein AB [Clostridia bacterium]
MQDMDFLKSFHTAAQLLPERLWKAAYSLDEQQRQQCEELRVRLGRPLAATVAGRTVLLGDGAVLPVKEELDQLLARATECSVHTYLEQLWQGYLTTKHGHRLGICSQMVSGERQVLRGLSSVNIRVARQIRGLDEAVPVCGKDGFQSTLILAPPGAGKTTLLRELCRRLSLDWRVAIADERYEIAACADGKPRFSVGACDVLSGGHKRETVPMLLRSMSPQILAVDEITQEEDCRVLLDCVGCGCGLLATAHGTGADDLKRRPAYRQLLEHQVFRQVIRIEQKGGGRRYELCSLEEVL